MIDKRIEAPLVLKELNDPELMFFESCDDMLSDRFDILWDEEFEGWDSRGFHFKLKRRYPTARWWHRLFNVDRSYLELVSVEHSGIDIQRVLEKELGLVYRSRSQQRLSIAQLIRHGLDRETKSACSHRRVAGQDHCQ